MMNNLFSCAFPLLLLTVGVSVGFGVNLKKWYGWIQVLAGFLLGWLMGWPMQNMAGSIILGIFFAVITIVLGPIALKQRQL